MSSALNSNPKKDQCDTCEVMKMNDHPTDVQKDAHDAHLAGKLETNIERDNDRKNNEHFTVCFDLQNVFALPKDDVLNFFHRLGLMC